MHDPSSAVFGIDELLSTILRHDVGGSMRGVCRRWKWEWDRLHQTQTFSYSLLEQRRELGHAAICLEYETRALSHQDACGDVWSIPVPAQHVKRMSNAMKYQLGVDASVLCTNGPAHVFLTKGSKSTRMDVIQTSIQNHTVSLFSGSITENTNSGMLRDLGRFYCFLDRLGPGNVEALRNRTECDIELLDTFRPRQGQVVLSGKVVENGRFLVIKANQNHPYVTSARDVEGKIYTYNNDTWLRTRPVLRTQPEILSKTTTTTTTPSVIMPPSKEVGRATKDIDGGGLEQVAAMFPGSVVFEATDTLEHLPVGGRLLVCVKDKDGNVKTPIDPNKKFHSTDIVIGTAIDRAFVGPTSTCKKEMSVSTSKQTCYTRPIAGSARSEKFHSEVRRIFDYDHYAKCVDAHPLHAAKQGFFKNGDAIKGVAKLAGKGKVFRPIGEDDDGNLVDFVVRRKVFNPARAYTDTNSDFDTDAIREFCESEGANTRTGNLCVDPVPIFFADATQCTQYDQIRSSAATIMVVSFRPDWVNTDLSNISWPSRVEYMQCLNVGLARGGEVALSAPNFMDDEEPSSGPSGIDFTTNGKRESDEDEEENDDDQSLEAFTRTRKKKMRTDDTP